jgi:hypothetical protein
VVTEPVPQPIAEFTEALNAMEVVGRSVRGFLTVRRTPDRRVRSEFTRGALARLGTGGKVAEEIRSALAAALADYDAQYAAVRRRIVGSDHDTGDGSGR